MKEIQEKLTLLQGRVKETARLLGIEGKLTRIQEIDALAHAPDFWNDQKRAQALSKERESLKAIVDQVRAQESVLEDVKATLELLREESAPELEEEAAKNLHAVESALEAMDFQRMLSGENDKCGAILTINAGAGGTEACDWAAILLRMYLRWADMRGYKAEIVDFTEGDGAGYRSATVTISGDYAYGYLKAENGVHRLVRISPFDANKRRHTSFASVYAISDVQDDIEIEVKPEDLRVDTFRSGGAGGQKVNKTDSAVRFTHLPTGIVVACQTERSQHQNRATAMRLLKAKLYDLEMEKKRKEQDAIEKSKKRIEWGSQIRSYVMQPYQLIKDHRTGFETGNIQAVMDGDLDAFMKKFLLSGE
ncbi:MAG: peptide chain release factor 2 [Deltaproteobacteria bacterium]|nr:peptide chain release factor 2 [Deltaproteobacteria bacterium]